MDFPLPNEQGRNHGRSRPCFPQFSLGRSDRRLAHLDLPVFNLLVAPQAVHLFLSHVFLMEELHVAVLLGAVHVAEETPVFGRYAVTPGDLGVTLAAFLTCLKRRLMGKDLAVHLDNILGSGVAGRTTGHRFTGLRPLEMA